MQKENKTLATITFQNYFRLYGKLSGMTGTAVTEAEEFEAIYKLDIIEIPTNKPVIRIDDPDVVYKNEAGKNRAIIEQIVACHEKGQPVLVGTVSIEKSEYISQLLKRRGVAHTVLNAKSPREGGGDRRPGGQAGGRDHRHEHGRTRHGYRAGRQRGVPCENDLRKAGFDEAVIAEATATPTRTTRIYSMRARCSPRGLPRTSSSRTPRPRRSGRPGAFHPRHGAARVAPHRQPAARPPAVRATPAKAASSLR